MSFPLQQCYVHVPQKFGFPINLKVFKIKKKAPNMQGWDHYADILSKPNSIQLKNTWKKEK